MSDAASRTRWTGYAGAAAAVAALMTAGILGYAAATDAGRADGALRVDGAGAAVEQDADPPAAGPRVHGGRGEDGGRPEDAGPPEDAGRPQDAGPPPWARAGGPPADPVDCAAARTHGEYVSSVARTTPPGPEKGATVSAAAEADCPPGFRDRPED